MCPSSGKVWELPVNLALPLIVAASNLYQLKSLQKLANFKSVAIQNICHHVSPRKEVPDASR
jgi:hypothetical protein